MEDRSARVTPRIAGAVSFFYYHDLDAAVRWYETCLGLGKRFDDGWVVIFELARGGYIGLVDAANGALKPQADQDKGAIIALETPDLEDWYQRLRDDGGVTILEPPASGSKGLTEQFKVLDPGGYIVEFFRWRQLPAGWPASRDD